MIQNAVGVLGGLGPAATVQFMQRVLDLTVADSDQGHINMIVWNHATTPDRTAFLTGASDDDPLPSMIADARSLERAGARFIVMPCNTAGYFHEQLAESVDIPFVDILSETIELAQRKVPGLRLVGLLATNGTIQTGGYARVAADHGLELIIPEDDMQAEVMDMIYSGVKAGVPVERGRVSAAINHLRNRGAQAVVFGCTEMSVLGLEMGLVNEPDIADSLDALARETVLRAGKTLRDAQ